MKKGIACILAVGLMATAANAATIGLQWASGDPQNNTSGGGTVNIVMDFVQGDPAISGIIMSFANDLPNIELVGSSTNVGTFNDTSFPAPLGPTFGAQYVVSSPAATDDFVPAGQTGFVIGTFDVAINGPLDGSVKEIAGTLASAPNGVYSGAQPMTWDARYNTAYSGYIAWGDYGNPGWGTKTAKGHQPTPNPLLITKVPEPTSLALVALGGFAMLRRRR
jgi:hypothetical protein